MPRFQSFPTSKKSLTNNESIQQKISHCKKIIFQHLWLNSGSNQNTYREEKRIRKRAELDLIGRPQPTKWMCCATGTLVTKIM